MADYPKAIGAYSAYKVVGDFLYTSGQIPLNPDTMQIESEDIKDQTKQALLNVGGILKECNLGYEDVIKTTIFLTDMNDFASMNEVYATFFTPPYPARSAVGLKALPKDSKVEIEVIAYKKR